MEFGIVEIIVTTLAIIVLISVVILIKEKKKKSFLLKNGILYNNIIDLNEKYYIRRCVYTHKIHHSVESKRKLDNFDSLSFILQYYNYDYDSIKTEYKDLIFNEKVYESYLKEYDLIFNQDYFYENEIVNGSPFKNVESFIKYERKKTELIKKKLISKIVIDLHLTYDSPGGRNHWYRDEKFYKWDLYYFDGLIAQKSDYEMHKEYQRKLMTDSLRYDVLRRDRFKCAICGATASDGAKLEVDHIIPISKGGKTQLSNLQTLCKSCNRGKSNKL